MGRRNASFAVNMQLYPRANTCSDPSAANYRRMVRRSPTGHGGGARSAQSGAGEDAHAAFFLADGTGVPAMDPALRDIPMIYTHGMNKGVRGVRSPLDRGG